MIDNEDETGGELFRYRRGEDIRIYRLRVIEGGIEVWRITIRAGQLDDSIKEDDFRSADAAVRFFEEIQRSLTAGGWRPVDPD
jgi:hypothetical protein